jgi:cell division protease FtsH
LKLPTLLDRQEILRVHAKDVSLDEEVDLYAIAKECSNFNGADLANVINEAVFFSLRRSPSGGGVVKQEDLTLALAKSKSLVGNRLTADVDRNPN